MCKLNFTLYPLTTFSQHVINQWSLDVTCYWVALSSTDWLGGKEKYKGQPVKEAPGPCLSPSSSLFFVFLLSERSWPQLHAAALRTEAGAGWWCSVPSSPSASPMLFPKPSPCTSRRSSATLAFPTARSPGFPPSCWPLCMQEVSETFQSFISTAGFFWADPNEY